MKTIKPLVIPPDLADAVAARIWASVTVTPAPLSSNVRGPCWLAAGWDDGKGFKKMRVANRAFFRHRVAYTLVVGEIGEGLVLDHQCRNRACCNPAHLEPVTVNENTSRGSGAWMLKYGYYGHFKDSERNKGSRHEQ